MKTCKCDPLKGEECAVCNPRPGADEQLVTAVILGRMFAPRPEGMPYAGQNEAERALMTKAKVSGQAQRKRAEKPRAGIPKGLFIKGVDAYGAERYNSSESGPLKRGWKKKLVAAMHRKQKGEPNPQKLDWRTIVRHLPEWGYTLESLQKSIEDWKP